MEFNFEQLKNKKIMLIGDFMLDEYIFGEITRLSPEAPVPVVSVKGYERCLGGAGNVAANITSLGSEVIAIGAAGIGYDSNSIYGIMRANKINCDNMIHIDCETTKKTRVISDGKHILRIDNDAIIQMGPYEIGEVERTVIKNIDDVSTVIISDYSKGFVSHSVSLKAIAIANKAKKPIIVDPKGPDYKKYRRATVITPNIKEACEAVGSFSRFDNHIAERFSYLTNVDNVVMTKGKDGMTVYERGKVAVDIKAEERKIFDTSGAGDTVVAILSLCIAAGADIYEAARVANYAAGHVVEKIGARPITIKDLEG